MRVFEALAGELKRQGVTAVFTFMSDDILDLCVELVRHDVRLFKTRHEAAAVAMADGYSRASGSLGVALVGRGPGLANALITLINAAKARTATAVLVVAGDSPIGIEDPALGHAASSQPKYIDQPGLLTAAGVANVRLCSPDTAAAELASAISRSRAGGTTLVNLPTDVARAKVRETSVKIEQPLAATPGEPDPGEIAAVADFLQATWAAQHPVIIAGRGAVLAGALPELRRLGDRTGALLATSALAKSLFAGDAYDIGISGTMSTGVAQELLVGADVILAFGVGLMRYTTYNHELFPKAKIVQFDCDPSAFGRFLQPDLTVLGDARLSARALTDELSRRGHELVGYRRPEVAARIANYQIRDGLVDSGRPGALDPRVLMLKIDEVLPEKRSLVLDSGHHSSFSGAYLSVSSPDSFFFPQEFNAVGTALGFALGVAVARPDRLTVFETGDGGLMLSLADLDTAVRYGLPILVLISNDSALGAEVQIAEVRGLPSDVAFYDNPSFAALAEALGADGMTISSLSDVTKLKERLLDVRRPLVVDCKIGTQVRAEWVDFFQKSPSGGLD